MDKKFLLINLFSVCFISVTLSQKFYEDNTGIHLNIIDSIVILNTNDDFIELNIEVIEQHHEDTSCTRLFIYNFYKEIGIAKLDSSSISIYKHVPFGLGFIIENSDNTYLKPFSEQSVFLVNPEDIRKELIYHFPSIDKVNRKIVYGKISRNEIDKKPYEKIVLNSDNDSIEIDVYPMIRHHYRDLKKGEYKIYLVYSHYWQYSSNKEINSFLINDTDYKLSDCIFSGYLISNAIKLIVE